MALPVLRLVEKPRCGPAISIVGLWIYRQWVHSWYMYYVQIYIYIHSIRIVIVYDYMCVLCHCQSISGRCKLWGYSEIAIR